ncbi:hypothetical protein D3C85_1055720 [compost metagenome]
MNKQPKFRIGEEVILQSKDLPEYNGKYTISGITYDGEIYKGVEVGAVLKGVPYYDLGFLVEGKSWNFAVWSEPCIRKNYRTSSMSFSEMINSFDKSNVK